MRRTYISFLLVSVLYSVESVAQNWQPVSEEQLLGNKAVYTLRADTTIDGLYVGGKFDGIGNNTDLRSIALWKDGQWHALGNGLTSYQFPASLRDMVIYNGDLYVGGFLTDADGVVCNGIARWNGSSWSGVAGGLTVANGNHGVVWGLRVIENELYACGGFVDAGGVTVNGLAKWNGTSWSDVHDFPLFEAEGDVIHDCIVYNNELYVVGTFNGGISNGLWGIAKWDGNEWVGVGPVGTGPATCLAIYQGKLYVAGYFTTEMNPISPGNHIASWDGSNWDDVGGGLGNPNGPVYDMMVHDGKLYAVGSFITAGGTSAQFIATWDGNEWCDLGTEASNGLRTIESFQDTIYVGSGPVSFNGSELMSIRKLGGSIENENCGTLASVNDQNIAESELEVYPNPTNSTATIELLGHRPQDEVSVVLYDVHGRLLEVPTVVSTENLELNLSKLPTGMYFGQVVIGKELRTFKVVRE